MIPDKDCDDAHHVHVCRICGAGAPWCCRHRWTLGYTAIVVTLLLISALWELLVW